MSGRLVVNTVITLLVIASILAVASIDVGPARVLLTLLAVLLVLVLPGLLMTPLLFPTRSLGLPERVVLALGISLAVMSLGGQLLNIFPLGIRTASWLALLALLVAGALVIHRARDLAPITGLLGRRIVVIRLDAMRPVLWFVPALALLVLAVVVSRIGLQETFGEGFTQLWIGPVSSDGRTTELGIRNAELGSTKYRLEMLVDGAVQQQWPSIVLSPDQEWHTHVALPADPAAHSLEAYLYLGNRPDELYRRVSLRREASP